MVRSKNDVPGGEFEVFEPKSDKDVAGGTVTRAKAKCLNPECGAVLAPDRVRAQLAEQRGGADVVFDKSGRRIGGAQLLAVAVLRPGEPGRTYRLATERDYQAVFRAQGRVREMLAEWEKGGRKGLCPVPDESLPPIGTLGFRVQRYGMLQWGDLFTARQKVALATFASLITNRGAYSKSLCLPLGKMTDLANAICPWEPVAECPRQVLNQGRIKPAWDFAEGVPISESSGGFVTCLDNFIAGALSVGDVAPNGQVVLAAAQTSPLPEEAASVWFTDPPYYDAIPYACLSDFFFVWFKRAMPNEPLLKDPFDSTNPLTPKLLETIHDETQRSNGGMKDKAFFEASMADAFRVGRQRLRESGIGCVVFAHKTTEGWEALLSGIIKGGWTLTGSWPIATEMAHRLRARESAALATSVHLVCRPRPDSAPVGDWNEVLHGNKEKKQEGLSDRVGSWMERLQGEGVRGADLVFACIGPALEIFSRYSRVETADGREVKLAEYLEKVWEVVGRAALEQVLGTAEAKARNGAAGAVEEDARLTALFLWTLQSTNGESAGTRPDETDEDGASVEEEDEEENSQGKAKGYTLAFDVVRRFAQPLGINLPKWEGRIIETTKGVVRLFSVEERARILFGKDGAEAAAQRLEKAPAGDNFQLMLFTENAKESAAKSKGGGRGRRKAGADVPDEALETSREATTLDRVHAAMLLQASGRTNALRALLRAEIERGPDFLRLANALSALYPTGSEEERLLDAMLLAVPR
jgi:adenine-specific DNA methylase